MKSTIRNTAGVFSLLAVLNSCGYDPLSQRDGDILVRVGIKIDVGGVLYENLDGRIHIAGYNSSGVMMWTNDFDITGPVDVVSVRNGFDHYSLELINKWGVNDIQSNISADVLRNGRADGAYPVTYELGGSVESKKLVRYNTFIEVAQGYQLDYRPLDQVLLHYNEVGDLKSIEHQAYDLEKLEYTEAEIETFSYEGNHVSGIKVDYNGTETISYEYAYGTNGSMTITSHATGITGIGNLSIDFNTGQFVMDYTYSNGSSFSYQANTLFKNIVKDKTVVGGTTCSEGIYGFDKQINPFRHLGYISFDLINFSANNKIMEDVDYRACSYPTFIPVAHDYTYNDSGYPTSKITTFRISAGSTGHLRTDYYYEE